MKIYKVLVDELPYDCFACELSGDKHDMGNLECTVIGEDVYDYLHIRPTWCPLVVPDSVIFYHGKQFYKVQI